METTLPVAEFWPPYCTKLKNLLEAFVHVNNELMELLYHKKKTLTLNNKKLAHLYHLPKWQIIVITLNRKWFKPESNILLCSLQIICMKYMQSWEGLLSTLETKFSTTLAKNNNRASQTTIFAEVVKTSITITNNSPSWIISHLYNQNA